MKDMDDLMLLRNVDSDMSFLSGISYMIDTFCYQALL